MNEYGWIKRRETLNRAKITEEMDEVLWNLKVKELGEDAYKKAEPIKEKVTGTSGEGKEGEEKKKEEENT